MASVPTTEAASACPLLRVTVIWFAVAADAPPSVITWLLVSTWPSARMSTPEPVPEPDCPATPMVTTLGLITVAAAATVPLTFGAAGAGCVLTDIGSVPA